MGISLDRLEVLYATSRRADRNPPVAGRTVLLRLRDDLVVTQRWKQCIPFLVLCGLLLILVHGIALPRFMAITTTGCTILGGYWSIINGIAFG